MFRRIALVLALTFALPATAFAHGGGLDRDGGHHDRRRGGYHCHREPCFRLERERRERERQDEERRREEERRRDGE